VGTFVTIATDPNVIPIHSTGGSVDLTLVDESGAELDMGTGFDHFGPEAAALYFERGEVNKRAGDNRRILRKALIEAGFRYDEDEWWHFDYGNQIWAAALHKPKAIYSEVKEK
jgi:D-alanyl-D-alanine dipeptidase